MSFGAGIGGRNAQVGEESSRRESTHNTPAIGFPEFAHTPAPPIERTAVKPKTQGRALIERLKRKPHTYMDMLRYGISTSPWKRIREALGMDEQLLKVENRQGLVTWRVVKACR